MQELHLKRFGCKRLDESFWHGPCALSFYSLWPFLFVAFFFSLEFALHNIHASHTRLFLLFYKKNKKKAGKWKKNVFCIIFLGFETKVGHIIFIWHVYVPCLTWMNLFYCTLLFELCSARCVGVVYSFWSHDFDLIVTCFWL